MNAIALNPRGLRPATLPVVLALLFFSGCLEKHFVWSPDGTRAAVIAKDGLHLCDPDGQLSPLLLPDVYMAAWLGDSQRLVVARERKVGDWAPVARDLGPERAGKATAEADALWRNLEAGGKWGVLTNDLRQRKDVFVLMIYLRERYGEALHAKLNAGEWDEVKSLQAEFSDLIVARIVGARIETGTVLHEGLVKINDIRVAPGDRAVAFTADLALENDDASRLWLARIDAPVAVPVAEQTAAYPDWTPDGRSLVYVQASGGGAKDDLRLGTLLRRGVLAADGTVQVAPKAEDLAGLVFGKMTRVRCLRDGRILFNAAEFSLPISVQDADVEREELFAWDGARQATLVRMIPRGEAKNLPPNLTFFEVSPDGQKIVVGGVNGEVSVMLLASGEVHVWQKAGDYNLLSAPVWRNAEEISYVQRNPLLDGRRPARFGEIVRRRAVPGQGDQEVVLSRGWPKEVLEGIYSASDRN
jgi:hypothetical protein